MTPYSMVKTVTTLLGNILRINVDSSFNGMSYGIPSDNPFIGNTEGFREEIFAWGLRNPWRFSIDFETGQFWAGDVGWRRVEEVDLIENGKNYGWRTMEGSECANPNNPSNPLPSCDQTGLTLPIIEHVRSSGRASITGGYIYCGQSLWGPMFTEISRPAESGCLDTKTIKLLLIHFY